VTLDTPDDSPVIDPTDADVGFGQLKQKRRTIIILVFLMLLGDIIYLLLGNFIRTYPIFSTSFPSHNPSAYWITLIIDIILGLFLIIGKETARKLTIYRLIIGIICFSIYYIITADYPFLIAIIGSNIAFIIKLTKTPGTRWSTHAYDLFVISNILAIVLGIIWANTPHSIKDYSTIKIDVLSSAVPTEWVDNPLNVISDLIPSGLEGEKGITNESYSDESGSVRVEFIVINWAERLDDDYSWIDWDTFLLDTNNTRIGLSNQLIESGLSSYTDVVKIDSKIVKVDFKDCYEYAYSGSYWLLPNEQRFSYFTIFGEETLGIINLECDLEDWKRVEGIWIRIRDSIEID
jgi:hypothetical protein